MVGITFNYHYAIVILVEIAFSYHYVIVIFNCYDVTVIYVRFIMTTLNNALKIMDN